MQTPNWFEELFYSKEMWGYLGPFLLIFIGYKVTKEDKNLGLLWFIVMIFMSFYYMQHITDYSIHFFITIFGGVITCVVPQFKRK